MKKIVINGNRPLKGEVTISGAKNSVVALIPAAILADSPVTLDGVPDIQDVHSLIEILEIMGAKITFENNSFIKISNTNTIYTVDGLIKLDNLDLDVTLIGVPDNLKIIGIDNIQSKESHLYSLKLNNHN